jgi:type IV pilus assembly protein PilV
MRAGHQQGIVLIEALVAGLLFMIGLLGLVGVAARNISTQSDIEYRTQVTSLVSQMMDTIWLSVDRTSADTVISSLTAFQHRPVVKANCDFSGSASGLAVVTDWVAKVQDGAIIPPAAVANPATRIPGTTAAMQQIQFDATNNNEVTIRLCWQASTDVVPRQHVMRAYIH